VPSLLRKLRFFSVS